MPNPSVNPTARRGARGDNRGGQPDNRGQPPILLWETGEKKARARHRIRVPKQRGPARCGKTEEAVQRAGMVELFHAQRAAESDASVRLRVRSHVPGMRRHRAQADEAGIKKL